MVAGRSSKRSGRTDRKWRRQVVINLSEQAETALGRAESAGMSRTSVATNLMSWFASQDPLVQAAILGAVPMDSVPDFGERCAKATSAPA